MNEITGFDSLSEEEKIIKIRSKILEKLNCLLISEKSRKNESSYYKDIVEYIAPNIKSNKWHRLFEYYLNSKNNMKSLLSTIRPRENLH